jgi:hypothetical protein
MSYIVAVIKDGKTCVEIDGVYFKTEGLDDLAQYMLWKHDQHGERGYKALVLEVKQTLAEVDDKIVADILACKR